VLSYEALAQGTTTEHILSRLLSTVPAPRIAPSQDHDEDPLMPRQPESSPVTAYGGPTAPAPWAEPPAPTVPEPWAPPPAPPSRSTIPQPPVLPAVDESPASASGARPEPDDPLSRSG
jgi:hypothetical protein